jgi:hypothetical protein
VKKQTIFVTLLAFCIGITVGTIGALYYSTKTFSRSMMFHVANHSAEWARRAHQAYRTENPDIGIWALENLAEVHRKEAKLFGSENDIILGDLVLIYTRLAVLYKSKGDLQNYKKNISEALSVSQTRDSSEFASEEELLKLLNRIDGVPDRVEE